PRVAVVAVGGGKRGADAVSIPVGVGLRCGQGRPCRVAAVVVDAVANLRRSRILRRIAVIAVSVALGEPVAVVVALVGVGGRRPAGRRAVVVEPVAAKLDATRSDRGARIVAVAGADAVAVTVVVVLVGGRNGPRRAAAIVVEPVADLRRA